jgi:hypothetical protein
MAAARQSKPDQSVTKDMLKIKGLSGLESATPAARKAAAPGLLARTDKPDAAAARRDERGARPAVKGIQTQRINCDPFR